MLTTQLTTLYDEHAERMVLALLLQSPEHLGTVGLSPHDFVINAHQVMFSEMAAMESHEGPIDGIWLGSVLKQAGKLEAVGGMAGIWEMMEVAAVPDVGALKHYAGVVAEYRDRRRVQRLGQALLEGVAHGTASDALVHRALTELGAVAAGQAAAVWRSLGEYVRVALDQVDAAFRGEVKGRLTTGLKLLDQRFGILEPENLIIVAGRPSMGKTSLALGMALHVAQQGQTVGLVSLEMSGAQLAKRAMALQSEGLTVTALDRGTLTDRGWMALTTACEGLEGVPIWVTDDSSLSLPMVQRKARELSRQQGLDLLIIDYLQLMELNPRAKTLNEALGEISRGLKALARELKIPIVALSQLSRKCEERADKRPVLSDLRDSGAIEQDADVVVMVYRDEVYDRDSPDQGLAELLIRKNRNGPIGEEKVRFIAQQTKFEDA